MSQELRKQLQDLTLSQIIEYFDSRKGFEGEGRGADEKQIDLLKEMWAIQFPDDYLAFLKRFGKDHAPLFAKKDVSYGCSQDGKRIEHHYDLKYDFTVSGITAHRRKKRTREEKEMGLRLIGIQHHSEDGGYFYLATGEGAHPADTVVNVDAYGEAIIVSPNFRDFILDYGFLKKGRF